VYHAVLINLMLYTDKAHLRAFDSVPHKPLIDKLEQTGISTHILNWVTDYLTDREQKVVINGVCSSSEPVLSGVPQGQSLGHCCFSFMWMSWHVYPCLMVVNVFSMLMICYFDRSMFISLWTSNVSRMIYHL